MDANDLALYVGDNVKEIMKQYKVTNPQMAELLNLSVSQIKKIRNGKSLLEVQHGIVICKKYNINMERLYAVRMDIPLFKGEDKEEVDMSFEDTAQNLLLMINQVEDSYQRRRMFTYMNELLLREQLKRMN